MNTTPKAKMTPDELHQDIVNEFRRMGFAQHGGNEVPSGLKACADLFSGDRDERRGEGTVPPASASGDDCQS